MVRYGLLGRLDFGMVLLDGCFGGPLVRRCGGPELGGAVRGGLFVGYVAYACSVLILFCQSRDYVDG